jgi:small subunit ribosomal protein S3Ae
MMEIMLAKIQKSSLKELVKTLVKEEVGKQIQKECSSKIFPLQDSCMVRKVKILKKPKFDLTKLMELYQNDASLDKPVKKEAENALKTE